MKNWIDRIAVGVLAGVTLGAVACASGSGITTRTRLSAQDLAEAQFETAYDLLKAHNRVTIRSVSGSERIYVYTRGTSTGDIAAVSAPGRPSPEGSEGAGAFPGGAGEESSRSQARGGGFTADNESLLIVDEQEIQNPIQYLRQLAVSDIDELQILRPTEASSRYGGDGDVGAVVIRTKGSA